LDEAASPRERRERFGPFMQIRRAGRGGALACDTFDFPAVVAGDPYLLSEKGITMSELRNRMLQDLQLAGLAEGTQREYLRAVHQLTAYYMLSPDRLTERQVEDYLLYVRDELGVAKGTFEPLLAGLKFFYLRTLGRTWPLFTQKKSASRGRNVCPTCAATPTAAA
jgi:hypothetical protein